RRAASLWASGGVVMLVGLAWDRVFPINKNLWTSSYVLLTAGIAAQVLALCHWLVDVKRWRALSTPLAAFCRHPPSAYFLSVGLDSILTRWMVPRAPSLKAAIYQAGFASWLRPCCGAETASLAYAVVYVALWAVILMAMYRRRMFIGI